jgi:thioredoxin reductase
MLFDCAIVGGGPAGLSAALVLGRAKRNVLLLDEGKPRNAVTHESHGFLTRDGVKPGEFRAIAYEEVARYPSVEIQKVRVVSISKHETYFEVVTTQGEHFQAKTVLLATGLKDVLPEIDGIHDYYGKSLFACPYCDGWERRDQPLVVISDSISPFHLAKVVWNWSHDLLVCTNGHALLTAEEKESLQRNKIQVVEDKIVALVGENGMLEKVVFASQGESVRTGGFVGGWPVQASSQGADLGCEISAQGRIVTDALGRTAVKGVYAAGDTATPFAQLIMAAAEGSKAAAAINMDLIEGEFL